VKKNILALIAVLVAAGAAYQGGVTLPGSSAPPLTTRQTASPLQQAIEERRSDVQVEGEGVVIKLLPDDLKGSRHQRILLRLAWGGTLLIAHNIDLAPRVEGIGKGDTLRFFGEYEWNDKGGVVHWTHHDPGRRHVDGWLKHEGKTYQ
jgi:hypothetical protein